jgi:hypothetical protein
MSVAEAVVWAAVSLPIMAAVAFGGAKISHRLNTSRWTCTCRHPNYVHMGYTGECVNCRCEAFASAKPDLT